MSNHFRTLLAAVLSATVIGSGCDTQSKPKSAGAIAGAPHANAAVSSAPNGQPANATPSGVTGNPGALSPPSTPVVAWSAKVDPPRDEELRAVDQATDFAVADGEIALPQGANAHVAVASVREREWSSYRIRDGQKIGTITTKLPVARRMATSPDGRHLVISPLRGGKVVAQVWSFAKNQQIHELEIASEGSLDSLNFPGRDRLVTGNQVPWGLRVVVWDLVSGQALRELFVPSREYVGLIGTPAVSPGGRYMALLMKPYTLNLYDLESGQCTGRMELPHLGRVAQSHDVQIEFSPNGERLAACFSSRNMYDWLLCWESDSGRQVLDLQVDKNRLSRTPGRSFPHYQGRALQWLSDSSGWLLHGHFVLDATSGETVEEFAETDSRPRVALSRQSVLAPVRESPERFLRVLPAASGDALAAKLKPQRGPLNVDPARPDFAGGRPPQPRPQTPGTDLVPEPQFPVTPSSTPPAPNTVAESLRPEPPRVPLASDPSPTPTEGANPTTAPRANPLAALTNENRDAPYWKVEVDPPAQPLEIYGSAKIKVPVPSGANVRPLETPSNFVMIEGASGSLAAVDLRTAESVGTVSVKYAPFTFPVASSDGQLLACWTDDFPQAIEIWSFTTGKRVATITPPGESKYKHLHFAGNRWVVASDLSKNVAELAAWDVNSHQLVGRATLQGATDSEPHNAAMTSPGGRYVVALAGKSLHVLELPSLTLAGRVPVSIPSAPHVETEFKSQRLAFSPDGTRLAATYRNFGREHIFIWNFATGEVLLHRQYLRSFRERDAKIRRGIQPLVWFPDNSCLLYANDVVVDALTGAGVWFFDKGDDLMLPLSVSSMAMLEWGVGDGKGGSFSAVAVPKLLSQALEAARKAPSENHPRLTDSDETMIRDLRTYPDKVTWNARPDPLPPGNAKFVDKLPIGEGPPLVTSDVLLAPADTALAVVQKATNYRILGFNGKGPLRPERFNVLETWDLTTGKRRKKLDLPAESTILDVSLDGSLVLTGDHYWTSISLPAQGDGFYDRLDVWAPHLDRHAVGWRQAPRFVSHIDEAVRWAHFTDKRHVLVGTKSTVTSWALPECRAEYRLHDAGSFGALSPNRKYLLLYHAKRGLELFDTATGDKVGQLDVPYRLPDMVLKGATFHPNGQRLVGLLGQHAYMQMLEWNMADGTLTRDFALPFSTSSLRAELRWLDNDHLFAYGRSLNHKGHLLSLSQQAVAAKIEHGFDLQAHGAQLPQQWVLVHESTPRGPQELLVRKSILDQLPAGLDLSSQRTVYHPGVRVRLKTDFHLGGMEQVIATAREKLERNNFVLDGSASLCFAVTSRATTEEVTITKLRSDTEDRKTGEVIQVVLAHIVAYDAAGNTLLEYRERIPLDRPLSRPSESRDDYVRRIIHQFVKSIEFPPYLFPLRTLESTSTLKL